MELEIISKVHLFHCLSLAIYNTIQKKEKGAFKLKDYACSSLTELLINSLFLD